MRSMIQHGGATVMYMKQMIGRKGLRILDSRSSKKTPTYVINIWNELSHTSVLSRPDRTGKDSLQRGNCLRPCGHEPGTFMIS